jgi:coenzyme F420-0:L-glutamate ligase/coenzyme F420-1:gamma-L-glutamate ligase
VISVLPVPGLPEIRPGDDLGALIAAASADLRAGDVVVVAHKVVSKAEGRVVDLDGVSPSRRARRLGGPGSDLRQLEVVLGETVRVVRSRGGLVIGQTRHGFVCASAGVDHSNAEPGTVVLLPLDPDASARRIQAAIAEHTGVAVAVIVTDSFGRPFRKGTTDIAIGVAGLAPLRDLRGGTDRFGGSLRSTQIAVADEIAAAANLVRVGKADGLPVVVVRGVEIEGDGRATDLVIPVDRDLFR